MELKKENMKENVPENITTLPVQSSISYDAWKVQLREAAIIQNQSWDKFSAEIINYYFADDWKDDWKQFYDLGWSIEDSAKEMLWVVAMSEKDGYRKLNLPGQTCK